MDGMTVVVDLAKTVFEVAVANERGQIIDRKRCSRPQFMRFLARQQLSWVVLEACGTAHHNLTTTLRHGGCRWAMGCVASSPPNRGSDLPSR